MTQKDAPARHPFFHVRYISAQCSGNTSGTHEPLHFFTHHNTSRTAFDFIQFFHSNRLMISPCPSTSPVIFRHHAGQIFFQRSAEKYNAWAFLTTPHVKRPSRARPAHRQRPCFLPRWNRWRISWTSIRVLTASKHDPYALRNIVSTEFRANNSYTPGSSRPLMQGRVVRRDMISARAPFPRMFPLLRKLHLGKRLQLLSPACRGGLFRPARTTARPPCPPSSPLFFTFTRHAQGLCDRLSYSRSDTC